MGDGSEGHCDPLTWPFNLCTTRSMLAYLKVMEVFMKTRKLLKNVYFWHFLICGSPHYTVGSPGPDLIESLFGGILYSEVEGPWTPLSPSLYKAKKKILTNAYFVLQIKLRAFIRGSSTNQNSNGQLVSK